MIARLGIKLPPDVIAPKNVKCCLQYLSLSLSHTHTHTHTRVHIHVSSQTPLFLGKEGKRTLFWSVIQKSQKHTKKIMLIR